MTTSADENSALKRNSVHQTRLSLELQQLEKDRSIRLREMEKASQVFARRQEQIQGIRDKACVRRLTSAPPQKTSAKPLAYVTGVSCERLDDDSPFVTKTAKLESEPRKRQLRKTMTMPSFALLPSRTGSPQLSFVSAADPSQNRVHSGHSKRLSSESPLDERSPTGSVRFPVYSRNFSDLRQRRENQTSLTGMRRKAERRRDSIH